MSKKEDDNKSSPASKNKWMSMFIKDERNVTAAMAEPTIRLTTESPSLNYALSGGIAFGHSTIFYGPEQGGKSLTSMLAVAALHKMDPNAIAVLISSEMRVPQPDRLKVLGVDPERLLVRCSNTINGVFGWMVSEDSSFKEGGEGGGPGLSYAIQEGMPVRMIIVDSIKAIQGPKEMAMESLENHIIGDISKALNPALRTILPMIRKHKIAFIAIQQVNMNMDSNTSQYQKYILPSGMALRHFAETIALVSRVTSKDSKVFDESQKSIRELPVQKGHTVRVQVEKSNLATPFRDAEFRIHYDKGIIDTGLEVASLAANLNVIYHPLNDKGAPIAAQWCFKQSDGIEKKWIGFAKCVEDLELNPDLQRDIMNAVYVLDKGK